MKASNRDQIDEIPEKDQAAAIIDSGEGQRQPARNEPDQRPEIAFGAWPMDERRAQDDELEPGPLGRRNNGTLNRKLGAAIEIVGARRIAAAKRRSWPCRRTHRPDRAHQDEPPHLSRAGGPHQRRCSFDLDIAGCDVGRPMRPSSEMDDNVDTGEMTRPGRVRSDIPDRAQLDAGDRLCRPARSAEDGMAALGQILA
jgi:hypothetical protein